MKEVFIPESSIGLPNNQYRLLLLDGHCSHTSLDFMWECFTYKIILYYLIPHASHVLQPLDLTIFSSLKRTYRAAVARDSQLEDTAPVKKQQFLEYYSNARNSSISSTNIASGFASVGIVPWNPRKVLSSPFVIQRIRDDDIQQPASCSQGTGNENVPRTPKSQRDIYQAVKQLQKATPLDRSTRTLFSKAGLALDRLQFHLAGTERQLASYRRQVNEYSSKSKRKEAVDMNKVFVNIADIKRTYDRVQSELATTRRATIRSRAPIAPPQPPQVIKDPF